MATRLIWLLFAFVASSLATTPATSALDAAVRGWRAAPSRQSGSLLQAVAPTHHAAARHAESGARNVHVDGAIRADAFTLAEIREPATTTRRSAIQSRARWRTCPYDATAPPCA